MSALKFSLHHKGYINRFLFSGICSEPSLYRPAVLEGRVNEWLSQGLSVYDHPCRREMIRRRREMPPPFEAMTDMLPGEGINILGECAAAEIYFPFGSEGFAHTAFYGKPAHLRGYLGVVIEAPENEDAPFEMHVSGSAALWLNRELQADFAPLVRNTEESTAIRLPLKKGKNHLVICLEDFAERDVELRLRLRYLGRQNLSQSVPAPDGVDSFKVQMAEALLESLCFTRDVYIDQRVVLQLRSSLPEPVALKIHCSGNVPPMEKNVLPGDGQLTLFNSQDFPAGFYLFRVSLMTEGLEMHKIIGTYAGNSKWENVGGETYAQRKAIVGKIIRTSREHEDYRALLLLEDGAEAAPLEKIFEDHLNWVEEKRDCSDFRLMVLLCLYVRYGHRLTPSFRTRLVQSMLQYRYWIDEPGDDVMWFFSENHALMFHACQYLAGLALPQEVFVSSGLTGREAAEKAEGLLRQWFDAFMEEGSTEWNSSTYIPIDFMALGYLDLLAPRDSVIGQRARQALDLMCYHLALCEHRGVVMTSFGRTYEKELKGSLSTGMTSLLYLFYGTAHMNQHTRALVPFVLGDYEPPAEYGRYTSLDGRRQVTFENTQGLDRFVNLYLYKNAGALLSTAVCFRPFAQGYQESIVQAAIDPGAQVLINHPGESEAYGSGRPGFWAGNGVLPRAFQHESRSFVQYCIPEDSPIDYTHAYVPVGEFTSWRISEYAAALEKDGAYIGLRAMRKLKLQKKGPCTNRELISLGRENLWLVKVSRPGEYANASDLLKEMEEIAILWEDKDHIRILWGDAVYRMDHDCLSLHDTPLHQYPLSIRGVVKEEVL